MAQKETENNADAKFWGDKQRALWYVMVFSGVVNSFALPLRINGMHRTQSYHTRLHLLSRETYPKYSVKSVLNFDRPPPHPLVITSSCT